MITQYEFSLIHRFLMQNSMISHYFGIFEAMYHWEENDSTVITLQPSVVTTLRMWNKYNMLRQIIVWVRTNLTKYQCNGSSGGRIRQIRKLDKRIDPTIFQNGQER